jgi:nitrite reductase/ring-hydroxylating ferredoxin subunit
MSHSGADVVMVSHQGSLGDGTIICPLHKSAFSLETGELAGDWCPFPPVLGPLVLGKLQPPRDLAIFQVTTTMMMTTGTHAR